MTRGVTARQCNRLSQCPEAYAGIGSAVLHTPVHPAYALFGLPSIVTVPLASP